MADVVKFPSAAGAPDLVLVLETLLAEAREGELTFIAFVAEYQPGDFVIDKLGMTRETASVLRLLQLLADKL